MITASTPSLKASRRPVSDSPARRLGGDAVFRGAHATRSRWRDAFPLRGAVLVRADAADPLEGGAQRVRGAVADGTGDRGDGLGRVQDEVGGQRHPPLGEELHRRLAHHVGETPGQRGPGHPRLPGQRADRPRLGRAFLQQPDRLRHHRVAPGTVPAGRGLFRPAEVGTHGVDQQQVEEPVEDRVLTYVVAQHLGGEQAENRGLPFVAAQHQPRRQRVEQPPADLALGVGRYR